MNCFSPPTILNASTVAASPPLADSLNSYTTTSSWQEGNSVLLTQVEVPFQVPRMAARGAAAKAVVATQSPIRDASGP